MEEQLQAGIRVLDIRCMNDFSGAAGNYFSIWHGPLYRFGTFDQVADVCKAFLAAHPGETIVMRVRQENPPDPKCTQSFTATFEWYRDTKYPGLFADVGEGTTIPRLGQVRGKVVVLQDYDHSPFWGIRYITPGSHPPFDPQDEYVVALSKAGLDAKWAAIYRHLYATNVGNRTTTWYLNYASGGTLATPDVVAGGSSFAGGRVAGMNDRLLALLRASGPLDPPAGSGSGKVPLACTGTVMMDFPGPGLIQAVIASNPGAPVAPYFSDVAGSPYETAIYEMAKRRIILGFEDQSFRPDVAVTRQQFAKMIVKTLGLVVTGNEVCPFRDVAAQMGKDPWYPSKYVAVCAAHEITKGLPDATFDPEGDISISNSSPWWPGRPAWPTRRPTTYLCPSSVPGAVRSVRALSERQQGRVRGAAGRSAGCGSVLRLLRLVHPRRVRAIALRSRRDVPAVTFRPLRQ